MKQTTEPQTANANCMSLFEGQEVELTIEKPASGGRMIARHLGQVVLVRGAIPGERVRAWIERAEKRMAYAVTREVVEASPDRRPAGPEPERPAVRRRALLAHRLRPPARDQVRRDPRRLRPARPLSDRSSDRRRRIPEEGYRMRARFHVHGGRAGFYREGTHQLCDAGATKQLRAETVAAVGRLAASLEREAPGDVVSITMAENIAGDERAAHLELAPRARVADGRSNARRPTRSWPASARWSRRRGSGDRSAIPWSSDPVDRARRRPRRRGHAPRGTPRRSSRATATCSRRSCRRSPRRCPTAGKSSICTPASASSRSRSPRSGGSR